jgi:hypothetical protein
MYRLSQSSTGQFVLVHEASNTVMVGDDLAATFERMHARVAAVPEAGAPQAGVPASTPIARERWIVLAVLATLPFVWLGALHVSLGRLVAELRSVTAAPAQADPAADELRNRIDRLEQRVDGLGRGPVRTPRPKPVPAPAAAPADPVDPTREGEDGDDD